VLTTPFLIDAHRPRIFWRETGAYGPPCASSFPRAGLLVFSAWCLGVLNSHRRFFLSYTAPVIWNAAMIATLWGFGGRYAQYPLAVILSWGSVAGSALQVAVQMPVVLRLLHGLHLSLAYHLENVRVVVRNFFPVFISRGVVQISAYVDALLASLLPTGAVAALAYAQTLYTLPVSLFGMSVSAAELPAMSGAVGSESEFAEVLRSRLDAGLRQIAFLVIPSVAAFLVLGDVIVAAIYQSGRFTHDDVTYVWGILAGATVGLLHPHWDGCIRPPIMRCAILARRFATRSCGFSSPRFSDISRPFLCLTCWGLLPAGAWPASRFQPASLRGSSSRCCGAP